MKCPHCGDAGSQDWLSTDGDRLASYRCAVCGRLYDSSDLPTLVERLNQLKKSADWLATQHAEFSKRIAELEAQIKAARGQ